MAEDVHALAAHVGRHLARLRQEDAVHPISGDDGLDLRWLALANDHLQQGFMCLLRAIERPHGY